MSTKSQQPQFQNNRPSIVNHNISTVSEVAPKTRTAPNQLPMNPNSLNKGNSGAAAPTTPTVTIAKATTPVQILSRIIFLKVGQIDTRNERYDAEAYIECMWEDDEIFKYLSTPNLDKDGKPAPPSNQNKSNSPSATSLINVKNVINNLNYLEYDPNLFWSPQLYIENAIGDLKEEIRYKLEIVEKEGSNLQKETSCKLQNLTNNLTVKVTEMRKVRGIFYERLELYDFPMDIQEISITLTSKRSVSEVELVENRRDPSSINIEDFLDQQEWDLFDFVKPGHRTIVDPWRKYERSAFLVKSYISRKPGYYLYNAYMLIFLITTLGFVPFAFDPNGPQFRCQVTGLLILTSVNFRWLVTQRLPSVPYLTSLDKYAIGSLFHLVIFCVWHSIIGSTTIASEASYKKKFDCYFLYGSSTFFILYNIFYACWFLKMSRSIKKFLDDGQSEAKKAAEERAIEFAEPPAIKEKSPRKTKEPVTTNNSSHSNNNNNINNNSTPNSPNTFNRGGNGSNNSNSAKTASQPSTPKNLMVNVNSQQKVNTNINTPQIKSPNLHQKMGGINEESTRLLRINSIGMNNMLKANQKLNAV